MQERQKYRLHKTELGVSLIRNCCREAELSSVGPQVTRLQWITGFMQERRTESAELRYRATKPVVFLRNEGTHLLLILQESGESSAELQKQLEATAGS